MKASDRGLLLHTIHCYILWFNTSHYQTIRILVGDIVASNWSIIVMRFSPVNKETTWSNIKQLNIDGLVRTIWRKCKYITSIYNALLEIMLEAQMVTWLFNQQCYLLASNNYMMTECLMTWWTFSVMNTK